STRGCSSSWPTTARRSTGTRCRTPTAEHYRLSATSETKADRTAGAAPSHRAARRAGLSYHLRRRERASPRTDLEVGKDQVVTRSDTGGQTVIAVGIAPMHAAPSVRTEQVSQGLLGDPVELLEARGGWRYVRTPDQYAGWISNRALAAPAEWSGDLWEVLPLWANLRYLPDARAAARMTALAGPRLPLVARSQGGAG